MLRRHSEPANYGQGIQSEESQLGRNQLGRKNLGCSFALPALSRLSRVVFPRPEEHLDLAKDHSVFLFVDINLE